MNSSASKKPASYRDLIFWRKAMTLATDLGHTNRSQAGEAVVLIEELRRMLNALRRKLETPRT